MRRDQHEVRSLSLDLPPFVVHAHVVISAQQDSAVDARAAAVSMPVVDMVRLDHADPPSAVPESASAVSYCQRNALCPCVEAPSSTDIERVAERVNIHLLESVYTDVAFNRGSRDRVALPEDPPSPCGRVKLVTHHNNLDRRTVPTEKLCGIREGPCTQQVEKGVASCTRSFRL